MKKILAIFIYSYMSIFAVQAIIGGMVFGGNRNITLLLVLMAITLLNVFVSPVLGILSLPSRGPGFLFLQFILNGLVIYMLTIFVPSFGITSASVSELIILGFVLPSKNLSKLWALVFSALLYVLILNFFRWLSDEDK